MVPLSTVVKQEDIPKLICQCCHVRNIYLVSCEKIADARRRERSYACAPWYLHLAVLSLLDAYQRYF